MTVDITTWLTEIGLEKYASAFMENEIQVSDVAHLSEDDLKELGLPLGPRRRLQAVVMSTASEQSAEPSNAREIPDTQYHEPNAGANADSDAQRRQLTVMFVDLVGSTDIARRVDIEDLRDVNRAYQKAASQAIAQFGGTVAKYMGDGILAYFGYPIAHENDAERAVHSGLAIVELVRGIEIKDNSGSALDLAVRVGIATGMVVVGDLIGEGTAQERSVVGETPNLAARVEAAASKNTVAVAPSTYRLTKNLFEYISLGERALKGFDDEVELWSALAHVEVQSRFQAMRAQALSPLVGRADEVALLNRRWSLAKDWEGHAVFLNGEPGIGKSRLTEAIREKVSSEPHHRLSFQCSPHHSSNPYYPFTSQLLHAAGAAASILHAMRLETIDASLHCADRAAVLSLFGRVDEAFVELTPNQRKQRIVEALVENIVALSRSAPVLCVVEDLHWADPSSLEVLDRLLLEIERNAVLCVATHRPEFKPRWVGQAGTTLLTLGRMGTRESRQLAEFALRSTGFSREMIETISERADGIPLFIEELTQSALETSGVLALPDAGGQGGDVTKAIPTTLLDTLMARLDRSPQAREIAQVAAVVGRDFDYALVEAVTDMPTASAREGMSHLMDTGLVQASGELSEARCRFKHALICDAAYGTLTRNRKRQLHGALARQLEQYTTDLGPAAPTVIAHHYGEAGLAETAISWFEKAGRAAMAQSAFVEAGAIYERAISLCADLESEDDKIRVEFELQTTLGLVYSTTHGYASKQTETAYLRAADLSEELQSDREMFRIQLGLRTFYQVSGRGNEALRTAHRCLEIAERSNDELLLVQAHVALGHTYCVQADFGDANYHLTESEKRYDPNQHAEHLGLYGLDPGVFGHGIHALTSWLQGRTNSSRLEIKNARELSVALGHVPSIEQAWNAAGHYFLFGGRFSEARDAIAEAQAIANKHGFAMRIAMGNIIDCAARQGDGGRIGVTSRKVVWLFPEQL